MMDTCHYCGYQYHPMPVFQLKGGETGDDVRAFWTGDPDQEPQRPTRIHVCHLRVMYDEDGNFVELDHNHRECVRKAEADGYEYRRDLTPTR